MKLTFVTGNRGKFEEAQAKLTALGVDLVMRDADPVEIQAESLRDVARAKAEDAARKVEGPFFLDDAGLFIDAWEGFPGPYSAYVLKTLGLDGVLKLMADHEDRGAEFRAVIAYRAPEGEVHLFEGVCRGEIAHMPRSEGHGFGYDPIFVPEGREETFAELSTGVKNELSHRGRALAAFMEHLRGRGDGS